MSLQAKLVSKKGPILIHLSFNGFQTKTNLIFHQNEVCVTLYEAAERIHFRKVTCVFCTIIVLLKHKKKRIENVRFRLYQHLEHFRSKFWLGFNFGVQNFD